MNNNNDNNDNDNNHNDYCILMIIIVIIILYVFTRMRKPLNRKFFCRLDFRNIICFVVEVTSTRQWAALATSCQQPSFQGRPQQTQRHLPQRRWHGHSQLDAVRVSSVGDRTPGPGHCCLSEVKTYLGAEIPCICKGHDNSWWASGS